MMSALHLLLLAGPGLTAGQSDQVSDTSYQQQFQSRRYPDRSDRYYTATSPGPVAVRDAAGDIARQAGRVFSNTSLADLYWVDSIHLPTPANPYPTRGSNS